MDHACKSSLVVPENALESGFEGTEYLRSISKPCDPPPWDGVRLRTILVRSTAATFLQKKKKNSEIIKQACGSDGYT